MVRLWVTTPFQFGVRGSPGLCAMISRRYACEEKTGWGALSDDF